MIDILISFWNWLLNYVSTATIVLQVIIGTIVGAFLGLIFRATSKTTEFITKNKPEAVLAILGFIGLLLLWFSHNLAIALRIDQTAIIIAGVILLTVALSKVIFRGVSYAYGRGLKEA